MPIVCTGVAPKYRKQQSTKADRLAPVKRASNAQKKPMFKYGSVANKKSIINSFNLY